MTKENLKQALISILIGACIAFFTTLFQGALDWLTDYTRAGVSGVGGTLYYALKNIKYHG